MKKILIGGAGGAPSENVIKSLLTDDKEEIIGMGSEIKDLVLSSASKKYKMPYAYDMNYEEKLLKLLKMEKPDLVHFQNDIEILKISEMRNKVLETGTKLYMPNQETIKNCVDKGKSYDIWKYNGVTVPNTIRINDETDLKWAFNNLLNETGELWLRMTIGGGGKGALPTNDYDFAKLWIDKYKGWGNFTAAELLSPNTITFLSIWYEGELVVAQTRKRRSWNLGNRTLSGVTGITGVGETTSDEIVTQTSLDAIAAIDKRPHGIFGVDLTYDFVGVPKVTEINIARFFTTVHFFTEAGLNMPKIYKDIALYNEFPALEKKINPLPNGLLWIRSMDKEPFLTNEKQIGNIINEV